MASNRGTPSGGTKAATGERMTCWVPSCRRTHLLGRDGAGWWWCWRHWWSRKLWSRILPAEVQW